MNTLTDLSRERRIEALARVCHDANAAWSKENDELARNWQTAPNWQRESAIAGVTAALNQLTAEEQHQAWCEHKRKDGWIHGPRKDDIAKTHPCLIPYNKLPAWQRSKDELFIAIVNALAPALDLR